MPVKSKKKYILLHHSATARDTTCFEAVNEYHKKKWNLISRLGCYIGYQYFISSKGKVFQGRVDSEAGIHCKQKNMNFESIGICLAGNFDKEQPTQEQLKALEVLLRRLIKKYSIPLENLKFHRDFARKSCPGKNITANFFQDLLKQNNSLVTSENDMMKLIQKKGEEEVYALDRFNCRHSLVNWDTLKRGIKAGLWSGKIETVDDFVQFKLGDLIVLLPDN